MASFALESTLMCSLPAFLTDFQPSCMVETEVLNALQRWDLLCRYPVMFMSYLDVLVPVLKGSWERT